MKSTRRVSKAKGCRVIPISNGLKSPQDHYLALGQPLRHTFGGVILVYIHKCKAQLL